MEFREGRAPPFQYALSLLRRRVMVGLGLAGGKSPRCLRSGDLVKHTGKLAKHALPSLGGRIGMSTRTAAKLPSERRRVAIVGAVVCALPILAIGLFAALARTDDIDAFLYAYYAKQMLGGQELYADLWDNKPPGIFWADVVGLWFAGGRWLGVVLVCSLAAAGSCVMFFLSARRLYGVGPAAIGVVMASLYVFLYDYHVGGNRPNTFYVFFELCVMAAYVHSFGRENKATWWLYAAGMAAFASVMFRQTAFAAAMAVTLHHVLVTVTGRQGPRTLIRNAVAFAAGCGTIAVVVTLMLWATSDMGHAWHGIVTSNVGYFAQRGKSRLLPEMFRWEDHLDVLGLPLILAIGAVVYTVFERMRMRSAEENTSESDRPPAAFALVAMWLPIAVYLALVGPSKRMMYFGIALAPLVLLATHGVWLLLREQDERRPPRFSVVVAVLWFAFMMVPGVARQWDAALIAHFRRFDDRSTPRHEYIVRAIRRHTEPDETIYMWGYLPAVYWYADRPQAQRYIVTTLIDQWGRRAQPYVDVVIEDLKRAPPKAIIVGQRELRTIEDPPEGHPVEYADFGDWLREHYDMSPDGESRSVWIRKD